MSTCLSLRMWVKIRKFSMIEDAVSGNQILYTAGCMGPGGKHVLRCKMTFSLEGPPHSFIHKIFIGVC